MNHHSAHRWQLPHAVICNGHPGWFHFLAPVDGAAIGLGVQVWRANLELSRRTPTNGIAGSSSMFDFLRDEWEKYMAFYPQVCATSGMEEERTLPVVWQEGIRVRLPHSALTTADSFMMPNYSFVNFSAQQLLMARHDLSGRRQVLVFFITWASLLP